MKFSHKHNVYILVHTNESNLPCTIFLHSYIINKTATISSLLITSTAFRKPEHTHRFICVKIDVFLTKVVFEFIAKNSGILLYIYTNRSTQVQFQN